VEFFQLKFFYFWSTICSLEVLYEGLGINILQFLILKCVNPDP
jgi:hypothetical protein